MIKGLNHITLAVTNLDRSISFYETLLGCHPVARWEKGAYLEAGGLWLCLSCERQVSSRLDNSHIAFTVSTKDFGGMVKKLNNAGIKTWKNNQSEGDSFYFLDPDNHKLEIHAGTLKTRICHLKKQLPDIMEFIE